MRSLDSQITITVNILILILIMILTPILTLALILSCSLILILTPVLILIIGPYLHQIHIFHKSSTNIGNIQTKEALISKKCFSLHYTSSTQCIFFFFFFKFYLCFKIFLSDFLFLPTFYIKLCVSCVPLFSSEDAVGAVMHFLYEKPSQ